MVVILMKLNSTKAVFNAISLLACDIEQLSYVTKINISKVKSICESLINSGVISIYLDGDTECYSMTDRYFSYLIDIQADSISVIAISAKGTAVDRFDYTIKQRKKHLTRLFFPKSNLTLRLITALAFI